MSIAAGGAATKAPSAPLGISAAGSNACLTPQLRLRLSDDLLRSG